MEYVYAEPLSPDEFQVLVSCINDNNILLRYLRQRYVWGLLAYSTTGLDPRYLRGFERDFLKPITELRVDSRRGIRGVYRRSLWQPAGYEKNGGSPRHA